MICAFGKMKQCYVSMNGSVHGQESHTIFEAYVKECLMKSKQSKHIESLEHDLTCERSQVLSLQKMLNESKEALDYYKNNEMQLKMIIDEKDKSIEHTSLTLKEISDQLEMYKEEDKKKDEEIRMLKQAIEEMSSIEQQKQENTPNTSSSTLTMLDETGAATVILNNKQIQQLEEEISNKMEKIEELHELNKSLEDNMIQLQVNIVEYKENNAMQINNQMDSVYNSEKLLDEEISMWKQKVTTLESMNQCLEDELREIHEMKTSLGEELNRTKGEMQKNISDLEMEKHKLTEELNSLHEDLLKVESSFQMAFEVLGCVSSSGDICQSSLSKEDV